MSKKPRSDIYATCKNCLKTFLVNHPRSNSPRKYCSRPCAHKAQSQTVTLDMLLSRAQLNPKTGCLEWQGARYSRGYGAIRENYARLKVHRKAYELYHGVTLQSHELVMHTCDNPPCFLKEHLRIGTVKDNTQDMIAKGRQNPPRGEKAYNAKLTANDVRFIRMQPYPQTLDALAQRFHMHREYIRLVYLQKRWKHIT